MSLALNEIFIMRKNKNSNIQNCSNSLKNYVKKGTIKENAIDELYNRTTKKLEEDYRGRLHLLLYNGNNVKDYFTKRVNLEKVVYNYDDEDKLYITLADFKKKKNVASFKSIDQAKSNSSYQNYTENVSNFLTCDTNNYSNFETQTEETKRNKLLVKDIYDKFREVQLNREIKQLLLNEDKELPKHIERQIFERLNKEYNFMKEDKKKSNNNLKIYSSYKSKPFFQNKNLNLKKIDIFREKADELRTLKQKKHIKYLSPIFFLGKNKDKYKYIDNISYASHQKLKKDNIGKDINDIKKENIRYLKIMGKGINDLHEVNLENKDIIFHS